VIENECVYKFKFNSEGDIDKYKARFMAKVFSQNYVVDYEEAFTTVSNMSIVRIILSLLKPKVRRYSNLI